MATRNIIEYLNIMGHLQMKHEDTILDEVTGYALAAVGFWFQLSSGFQVDIQLFPSAPDLLLAPIHLEHHPVPLHLCGMVPDVHGEPHVNCCCLP
jgi:hypothetical protein